ncbi:ras-GEF domain-containing family member 1B-A-like isoform X3 [Clytia hemisphaerica]|uniref:ras-GEF domain-containing family member 1B-A-like isoform X3 n=1 Tax=Clytia hemisphaerica TaxID=252671 RepID=UPI0034D7ACAC
MVLSEKVKISLLKDFTIFGTLLRPRKLRKGVKKKTPKRGDENQSSSKQKDVDVSKHSEPLNYNDAGELVSGQLENLIHLMTPTKEYYPDKKYIFTFLLCSRLFMPPASLLRKLVDNIKVVVEKDKSVEQEVFRKFVNLLLDWSKQFPYDFKDKLMMAQFNKFSSMLKTSYPDLSKSLNLIAIHLVEKFKELLAYVEKANEFPINIDEEEKNFFDICQDPIMVAEQLALIELEKMSMLNAEQFVEKFIAEDITCSRLDLTESNKHSTTLELYVSWFNRLSYLVATEICTCPKKRDRIRLINFFINVGKHCLAIGNYNSLMAIITGLNMNAVGRMSKTWQKVNKGRFKKLESEMQPEANFAQYRKILKERMEHREDLVIPVFSIFVKDIYFLNEGIKDKLSNGMVNYEKFTLLSKQMNDFLSRRNKRCYYLRNDDVIKYFLETPVLGENGIYKSSFEVEKPENNFERDRFKSVRMKMGQTVDLR